MRETVKISWNDWSAEIFNNAQNSDIPVLLYLCTGWGNFVHRFENEVLGDSKIIQLIEKSYVPVRADIFKQPHIYDRYNRGGWPSICILSPTGELLHGSVLPGLSTTRDILEQVVDYYSRHKDQIKQKIQNSGLPSMPILKAENLPDAPDLQPLDQMDRDIEAWYDRKYSGFGRSPKLPKADLLKLMLDSEKEHIKNFALTTLKVIRESSLYDHIGGGFFRQCDDETWRFPQLEKLHSDNSELVSAYLKVSRLDNADCFRETVLKTLEFMEETLINDEGLIFAALDSETIPGDKADYYGWAEEDLRESLDEVVSEALIHHFGITKAASIPGTMFKCVPEIRVPSEQVAMRLGIEPEVTESIIKSGIDSLKKMRGGRKQPPIDETVYTSALGKFLASSGEAGVQFNKPAYLQQAFEISDYLWNSCRLENGGLKHHIDQEDEVLFLNDQVDVILGLLDLYQVSGRAKELIRAEQLASDTIKIFGEENSPGCYDFWSEEPVQGALRIKFMPFSGNSRLMLVSVLLGHLTENNSWHQRAVSLAESLKPMLSSYSLQYTHYMKALKYLSNPPLVIDLVSGDGVGKIRHEILENFKGSCLVRYFDPDQETPWTKCEKYSGATGKACMYIHDDSGKNGPFESVEELQNSIA